MVRRPTRPEVGAEVLKHFMRQDPEFKRLPTGIQGRAEDTLHEAFVSPETSVLNLENQSAGELSSIEATFLDKIVSDISGEESTLARQLTRDRREFLDQGNPAKFRSSLMRREAQARDIAEAGQSLTQSNQQGVSDLPAPAPHVVSAPPSQPPGPLERVIPGGAIGRINDPGERAKMQQLRAQAQQENVPLTQQFINNNVNPARTNTPTQMVKPATEIPAVRPAPQQPTPEPVVTQTPVPVAQPVPVATQPAVPVQQPAPVVVPPKPPVQVPGAGGGGAGFFAPIMSFFGF